jgi:hypothetical protein
MQSASCVVMVRPAAFGFNEQTAANNFFQDRAEKNNARLQQDALQQFDAMVFLLRENQVEVIVLQDSAEPPKPDAIFPNNWFTCRNGEITVFPMFAPNRRQEKRLELIKQIKSFSGANTIKDLSAYEQEQKFLEGTGSMVFDHENRTIYSCLSGRTNQELFEKFAREQGYVPVAFEAADENGQEIYHTNVMLCIGRKFAVICSAAIADAMERQFILEMLSTSGHEIIDISFEQMKNFAGNMLQLQDLQGRLYLLMSSTALNSLKLEQIQSLQKFCSFITPDVSHIEKAGGGSVRCMVAEIFY